MNENRYFPQKIFVDQRSLEFPLTRKILQRNPSIPVQTIQDSQELIQKIQILRDPVGEGKKYLLLTAQRGDFVKPCPCTPYYLGCHYYILNLDLNCPMDCSYCILQNYLTNPLITVHVNRKKLWTQVDDFLNGCANRIVRLGSGELGDSLSLDHITEHSKELIPYFKKKRNVLFEFKTKTSNIDNLLRMEPSDNIIVAWSLNSEEMAQKEEKGAPSVRARLQAAKEVSQRGYRTAFHFDPLIHYSGWEEGYEEIVEKMLEVVDHSRIAWVSLGSLRFLPPLKGIIQKRFPRTKIIYDEFIKGMDGKFRYFKPIRYKMYKKVIREINRKKKRNFPIYFCMESQELWGELLKKKPRDERDVEDYLSSSLG
ncbi:hypothetical protein KGY73_07490 [bacterium]|nr:hypothetical protein [bacterium]